MVLFFKRFLTHINIFVLAAILSSAVAVSCGPSPVSDNQSARDGGGNQQEKEPLSPRASPKDSQQTASTTSGSAPSSASVQKYAEWCGKIQWEGQESGIPSTWGQAAEYFRQLHSEYNAVDAPKEVEKYHAAQTAVITMSHSMAEGEDPDDPFSPFSLIAVGLLLGDTIEEAEAALAPEIKEILSATGCLGDGVEGGWQYDYHKDAITDEVTLYFTLKADADNDDGFMIISADCTDGFRGLFVDVNVRFIGDVGRATKMTVRFGEEEAFVETWESMRDVNFPDHITETSLAPPGGKVSEYINRVLSGDTVSMRYPGSRSIPEATMVFSTSGLSEVMNERSGSDCR